jgi:hypothetical protein
MIFPSTSSCILFNSSRSIWLSLTTSFTVDMPIMIDFVLLHFKGQKGWIVGCVYGGLPRGIVYMIVLRVNGQTVSCLAKEQGPAASKKNSYPVTGLRLSVQDDCLLS